MIDFQPPRISDKDWVDRLLRACAWRACDYNFTNLFAWGPVFQARIARLEGRLAVRLEHPSPACYLWPVGSGDLRAPLGALEAVPATARVEPFDVLRGPGSTGSSLWTCFPDSFFAGECARRFVYLFDVNRLADCRGKDFTPNAFISSFSQSKPGWTLRGDPGPA